MVMYCHNYNCDKDQLNVTMITHDLYTIDFHTMSSNSPVCPYCGNNLSTEILSVPEAFTKVTYPRVSGRGSSRGG